MISSRSILLNVFLRSVVLTSFFLTSSCSTEHSVRITDEASSSSVDQHSTLHVIALYLPNRIVDLLDIVRVRARVGPGAAFGIRISRYAQLYLGSYISIFAGLPGPRCEPSIPWPLGLESSSGAQISVLDETLDGGFSPHYSSTEIGGELHLLILGLALGIDPVEIADFFTGFFGYDLRNDDL